MVFLSFSQKMFHVAYTRLKFHAFDHDDPSGEGLWRVRKLHSLSDTTVHCVYSLHHVWRRFLKLIYCRCSGVARNLRQGACNVVLPIRLPFSSLPFPSLPLLSPFSSPFPSFPFEVGPLDTARGLGERYKLPSAVWCGAPAEIDFGAF